MGLRSGYKRGGAWGPVTLTDPLKYARRLGADVEAALDPRQAPGRVRRLADMSAEERAAMLALYSK